MLKQSEKFKTLMKSLVKLRPIQEFVCQFAEEKKERREISHSLILVSCLGCHTCLGNK